MMSLPTGCMITRLGVTTVLDVRQVPRVLVHDARTPVVHEYEDGSRRVIYHTDPRVRDMEIRWSIHTDTDWEALETVYGYTGPVTVHFRASSAAFLGVVEPGARARYGLGRRGGAWDHTMLLHGRLLTVELPETWVGSADGYEGDDASDTTGVTVVKVVNQATDEEICFSARECPWVWDASMFTTRQPTADQRRLDYSLAYRSMSVYPDCVLPVCVATSQTAYKVETIIDWEEPFALYPCWRDDPTEVYYCVALPERVREYCAGRRIADRAGTLHLNCLGVRAIGGLGVSATWVLTTKNDWEGNNETVDDPMQEENTTAVAGPEGDDDPAGYLAVGAEASDVITKWGATTTYKEAWGLAEYDGIIYGFFSLADHVFAASGETASPGTQAVPWDAEAGDWDHANAAHLWDAAVEMAPVDAGYFWRPIRPMTALVTTGDEEGMYVLLNRWSNTGWCVFRLNGDGWALIHNETKGVAFGIWATPSGASVIVAANNGTGGWWAQFPRVLRWNGSAMVDVTRPMDASGNDVNMGGRMCYTVGSVMYMPMYGARLGVMWSGVLQSADDGLTWTIAYANATTGPLSDWLADMGAVAPVGSTGVVWCGWRTWLWGPATWTKTTSDPPATLVGPATPRLADSVVTCWERAQDSGGTYYSRLYAPDFTPPGGAGDLLTYEDSSRFNRCGVTRGWSPLVSIGLWCGGADADGACFWGFAVEGGNGYRQIIHDWGATADATSLTADDSVTGGTVTYMLRTHDMLEALTGDHVPWRVLTLDDDGEAHFLFRGRYIQLRVVAAECDLGSLVDSTAVRATLHP